MMVTLTLTRGRVAAVLAKAADLLETETWHAHQTPIIGAIDRAADFVPGTGRTDAEATSLAAWDALAQHLGDEYPQEWERCPGRTQTDVVDALRAASKEVTAC